MLTPLKHKVNRMLDQQLQIESEMFADAKRRRDADNRKTVSRGAWSDSKLGRVYTQSAATRFTKVLKDTFVSFDPNKSGSNVRAINYLIKSGLEPEVIAHLFTKALYNMMPLVHRKRAKRVTLCIKAADLIHDEMRLRFFNSTPNRKALLKKLFKTFDRRTYPREWRKRTILNYFHAEQLSWSEWSSREKLAIGYALLVWFRDSTGLIDAPRNSQYVDPTPALLEHIEKTMGDRVLDFMLYKPMVVKPIPWSQGNLFRGGYHSNKVRSYPLIKGSKTRDVERMDNMNLTNVIPAVNALQETPWRVNKHILDVLSWTMFTKGGDIAGLPRANAYPLPPEPAGYRVDEEVTKEHNRRCFLVHNDNRELISKRLMVLTTIAVANQFKGYKEIYFPHNLDSRGRAYPLPVFLQPQGPDYTKALLEVAHGQPILNEEAVCWLAIAGANAYGNDKISLQERVNWAQDNDEMIFSIATDPKHDLRWMEASDPFQFLRFCYEWKAFWDTGYGFMSHMVVPVDATCSGLQHYSAMLRDEIGGRSVNLVPGLTRQDIYQDVADKVIEGLMHFAQKPDHPNFQIAQDWIKFGINRKITKRQVMVVPYSGTFSSCMEYTREAVLEKIKEGHPCGWDMNDTADHTQRIVVLAKLIWSSIDEVVVKGKQAMQWLSKAASEYAKWANKHLTGNAYTKSMKWVTPDGFEVIHYRADEKKKRLPTYLDGYVQLSYYEEMDKMSSKDLALAVAPNFVHSLDANLLRASVNKGLAVGITDYAMIHDSFGVHASRMGEFLNQCVKPAFVEMYQEDVLQQFAAKLPEVLELEALPTKGNLVLEHVTQSEFFFS